MRAYLGGSEVTSNCQRMSRTPDLNGIWSADIRLASQYASITEGVTELEIRANNGSTVLHAGPCWYGEDDGDANDQMTTLTSFDKRVKWVYRQMMDADGDYSDPSIFVDEENAVSIMAAAINNSIANDGAMGITVGTTAGGGVPLVGFKPTDFPWTLKQLWDFLADTGELDVMLNPSAGTSTVDLYNGDAGSDLSGSVVLDYNTGSRNCIGAKYTFDMKNVITRIRYFLGPKRPQYRGDIQHWAGDVQKDDPDLPDPPQSDIDSRISSGEAAWGLMREVQIHDANGDENSLRDLYFRLWQSEMIVRTVPRRLLQMIPEPGLVPSFGVADIISANAVLRGSVGGAQRVYNFTVEQDTEGNETITQLTVSGDQEV